MPTLGPTSWSRSVATDNRFGQNRLETPQTGYLEVWSPWRRRSKFGSAGVMMNVSFTRALVCCCTLASSAVLPLAAQNNSAPTRAQVGAADAVLRGRAQMDANDPGAVATLREAAQAALQSLTTVAGRDCLSAEPESLPDDVLTRGTAQKAAETHHYWGLAADKFAQRDESITALARAVRLAQAIKGNDTETQFLRRDTSNDLGRVLREGLPLIAPDDTLQTIASIAHGGLWQPARFSADGAASTTGDFLVTAGKVFPAQQPGATALAPAIPAFYQGVDKLRLPVSLQLDRTIIGYAREKSGPNIGQWRQQVRVYYASPYLTRGKRNDQPRAEAMALQFLRVNYLVRRNLGLTNLYSRGNRDSGVTSLWLLEVSALWPAEEEDPSVLAQLGPQTPTPNIGAAKSPSEPRITPLMRPWNVPIAGNTDSSPDEILFWKAGMARSEAEWVREIAHEYGHVVIPPFGGFRAPLEPFGNGMLGETLVLMWAAENPNRFAYQVAETPASTVGLPPAAGERFAAPREVNATELEDPLVSSFSEHVNRQALPSLKFFVAEGPLSPAKLKGDRQNLQFLQGVSVYLERVYGPSALSAVYQPLAVKAASIDDPLRRRQLLNTVNFVDGIALNLNALYLNQKTTKIWLPGAMNIDMTANDLINRASARMKAGGKTQVLLYIPPGTESLKIEGPGTNKLQSVGFPFAAGDNACRIFFGNRSGWQSFTLNAGADASIEGASLDRK